ncbi:MAG: twin-arginine translocase TatA/TatE family subunit [Marinilabiliales bacterium]|nr:MAG: twin-arginine translocase TatA/TatE family subunit [Marinilabiliales bacterium]
MNLDFNIIQQTGWLGGWEIAAIVLVVLLLFGGRKLPELMRGLGKGIKEFKDGVGGDEEKKDENTDETKKPDTKE